LMRKLMGEAAHSPFFTSLSWSDGPPGGTITFTAFIHNPDPTSYSGFALFGYLLFGPANFVQATDDALVSEDTRFPRYWKSLGVATVVTPMRPSLSISLPGSRPASTSATASWYSVIHSTLAKCSSAPPLT